MIIQSVVKFLNSKNFLYKVVIKSLSTASAGEIGRSLENNSETYGRENFQTFDAMVESRRKQAQKTVLVEVERNDDIKKIYSFFSDYGLILNMYEYVTNSRKILVEYAEAKSLQDLLKFRWKNIDKPQLPFFKLKIKSKSSQNCCPPSSSTDQIAVLKHINNTDGDLFQDLQRNSNDISCQMELLHQKLKMNELGWRLRFLACRKIEWLLPAFLSHGRVLPFGSSVNTFGNNHSDVDMILSFDYPEMEQSSEKESTQRYITNNSNSRESIKKNLEIFASLMSKYELGFSKVFKILNANVPIIKCHEDFTELECDITIHNISGYYMSELLYLFGCSDCRVRPLVYSIRWWAKQKQITQTTSPSSKITNFTLTLMILFYLMNTQPKVVPPIRLLNKLSGKSFTVDGITYSYVKDINLVPESANKQSLAELFRDFLGYYSGFDFKKTGLSLITGNTFSHTDRTPLIVQNPIEPSLNVCRNLNYEAIEIFKTECNDAFITFNNLLRSDLDCESSGGLLALINLTESLNPFGTKSKKQGRSFDIKDIMFDDHFGKSANIINNNGRHADRASEQRLRKTNKKRN